jgi:hypothetical protein
MRGPILRIYADRTLYAAQPRYPVLLYPLWGDIPDDPLRPSAGRYDEYERVGRSFFQLTTLAACDVAVLPGVWEDIVRSPDAIRAAQRFAGQVRAAGKPLVVFYWADSFRPVPLAGAIVFRTSFHRSRRAPTDFAMPAWSEDLVARYLGGQLPVRQKSDRPTVGFVGWPGHLGPRGAGQPGPLPLEQRAKLAYKWFARKLGAEKYDDTRARALQALEGSPRVHANFVYRETYLGSVVMGSSVRDAARIQTIRREFVDNLVGSDYALCCRGAGNYSYRLYEALSCGRIPLFVDTDAPLPFDFLVDWKQYCVWVDRSELPYIGEKLADFHAGLSPSGFVDLQHACRQFWEQFLSPQGFFGNFYRHFQPPGLPLLAGPPAGEPLSPRPSRP